MESFIVYFSDIVKMASVSLPARKSEMLFKENDIIKSVMKNQFIVQFLIVFILGFWCVPRSSFGFAGQLGAGVDAGYSATFKSGDASPDMLDGLAVGAHLTYGITKSFGLSFEANFDWHPDYIMQTLQAYQEEEEVVVGYLDSAAVTRCFLTSVAASVVYAIDITRVVPYLSLGLVGTRSDQEINSRHIAEYDLGIRIGFGFTYAVFDYLLLGAALHSDTYLLSTTPYNTRIAVLGQVTFVFDVSAKILAHQKERVNIEE